MTPKAEAPRRTAAARACPICGKPPSPAERPFCSRRCADIDLHRWLSGAYAVPARPEEEDERPEQARPEQD
jgi:endogenous inhibitor of DNA gyrase (YacG/DUF329 family)